MQLIHCLNCCSYLGILKKHKYFLCNNKLLLKDLKLQLRLVAASDKDTSLVLDALSGAVKDNSIELVTKTAVLKRSDLESYRLEAADGGLIIVHRAVGRLLLTDANGIYSPMLQQTIEEKSCLCLNRWKHLAYFVVRRRPACRDARVLLSTK